MRFKCGPAGERSRLIPGTALCRLAWLHNRWSGTGLTFSDSIVIWWAGMMRGAVSVAMVYYRFDPDNTSADEHSATIVVTTLQVVLYSTVGLGGLTGPLLQVLLPRQVRRARLLPARLPCCPLPSTGTRRFADVFPCAW